MNPIELVLNDFHRLQQHYLDGNLLPTAVVKEVVSRVATSDRPEVWISHVPRLLLKTQAEELDRLLKLHGRRVLEHMPLFGIPFAVKDNIDVAGMETTAACPAFAYVPKVSAHVVQKLQAAGAILIGKTNMDQFATGLVGARSPYGVVRNAFNPNYVSGGSSSGSAVAVALGLVSFALGTDTAGSGRVPAGFNNLVGLKPTRGLFSASGVVPACRTLDCVSVLTHNVRDAWSVTQVAAGYDATDAYSRTVHMLATRQQGYRIAVPEKLEFFGDPRAEKAFAHTMAKVATLPNVEIVTIPFDAFAEAAQLLYSGPWVAERRAAIGPLFDKQPEAIDPTVHAVVALADDYNAVDVFNGIYQLADLRREAERLMTDIDFLMVPTAPTIPTIDEVLKDPIPRNSALGIYTNCVNFFDLAALSVPAATREDGLPSGVTLIGPAGADHLLAAAGETIHALHGGPRTTSIMADPLPFNEPTVRLAVLGALLEGQPLNWQLLERGARKSSTTRTSGNYRLYALPDTTPPKPGLARVESGGTQIEVEVWEMPVRHFGNFVAEVPPPLGIGSLQLEDGEWVKGFICEPWALNAAKDITSFGSWRDYLVSW